MTMRHDFEKLKWKNPNGCIRPMGFMSGFGRCQLEGQRGDAVGMFSWRRHREGAKKNPIPARCQNGVRVQMYQEGIN